MPTFETPDRITLNVEYNLGDIRVTAGDRKDTVVDVRPSDAGRAADVRAAEQTRIDFSNGMLFIKGSTDWKRFAILTGNGAVDVTVGLPSHSDVRWEAGMGKFDGEGNLGQGDLKTGMGHIRLDRADAVKAESGYGDVVVDVSAGDVDLKTGSGEIRVNRVGGSTQIRNSDGHIRLGEAAGEVHIKAANGNVHIGKAQSSVTAKSANGKIRVGEATRGSVVLETAYGDVGIGIPEGTAAWLDVSTKYGKVRNALAPAGGPGESTESVEVRARTSYGDVAIHRPGQPAHPSRIQ
ncbi:DUF4097 family beta strand repeat-containing protein [Arthrobacter sp. BE255]|uniref:DUF4097 family beta strand repeat-containing protein n=1 Tax=Arthrobacter sp. BE255 TaxID=2817721 RepID=UPI002860DDF2|nr:DUF4097 family beta strand repeat-containing protein [Arthrobacter sp. BE255]MDR7159015.1 DUF4097 and DUF4098 domain-containing protein YvlB [Arthrobacter sp. BE255]